MTEHPHPIVQLTLTRIREFTREPEAIFWTLAFPILLSLGLGIAFRSGPAEVISIGTTSAALADTLRTNPQLDVQVSDEAAARQAFSAGRIAMIVSAGPDGGVTYRYDDTNPQGRNARALADRVIQRAGGQIDPVKAADDLVREPGSRYIDFVIPGLVGLGIMSNAVWGLGFSIVDARRRKLTKLLTATPMSRAHYLLSYLIWRLMILPIEVVVPIAFGALAFGVPVRGSIVLLAFVCVLAALSFSALGLLMASRARTVEAVSGLMNLILVPMWILSGVFFSSQRFPDVLQPLIHVLPLTALIDSLRAIMLQGAGIGELGLPLAVLSFWLVVCFTAAMKLFRWR